MKTTFLFILFIFLIGCTSENNQSANSLSDFIKADYSHYQSIINCELLPEKNLSSVERFIPILVTQLDKVRDNNDEVKFFFPIETENNSVSSFKILLNHQDQMLIDDMHKSLSDIPFQETALCNTEDSIYGRLSLYEANLESALTIIEIMDCSYLNNFNYATMKLVFEEFTDALRKVDPNISVSYSENLENNSQFRWFNVFNSIDDRKAFVEDWQDLSISNLIQDLFIEQSSCGISSLYKSYKVI
tara:strand:- start:333 stop:1067 length:735 start_codon:yes stop_codon:yes gene_type:complete